MAEFDQLWDYDHPDATERALRALLPQAAQDPAYHAQLLTQIARTQGLQGQFDAAHATLDAALAMLDGAPTVVRLRYLLERGRVLNSSGRPAEARPLFAEAWELGRAAGEDSLAVDAAHMIAIVEPSPAGQLEWNYKGLELAQRSPAARRWLASLYNNIGWTHADAGEHERALATFEQALALRREQGQPDLVRIARWCVARMLRLLGRPAEALAIQADLLRELQAGGGEDPYVNEELAACRQALGRG